MNIIKNRKKQNESKQGKIKSPMLISLFSFAVCLVMLSSCCFAWFTAAQGTKINIEAGTFGVKAVVSNSAVLVSQSDVVVGDSVTWIEVEAVGSESAIVLIKNGGTYQVSLTATGETSKGFCMVTVIVKDTAGQTMKETVYCTGTMVNGATVNFALKSTGGGVTELRIQPSWGVYQEQNGVVSTLVGDKILVEGEVEAPVMNLTESASEETSTVAETTAEVTTEAVETTTEVETTAEETTEAAETTTEIETTVEETTEVAETTTEVETTMEETTEVAETTIEFETSTEETTEAAETTSEVETTMEETTEAEEITTEVETTMEETTEAEETTTEVETTTEETTEAEETTTEVETTTEETMEAVETLETSAEETTAEATTESLSAKE